ncbi:hypothetical protein EC843_101981 [Buttiauxella sp. JUb87]|uniref:hypothetical protein n=1 Tax=Buttiauxella sp. JUb87 TaxID=2485129 RepID=UPI00105E912B|nr:hypothetical protein [Buttiauxella sp. JUb87]TDN54922.1 hypothetical protein EC843_101981 [Buttiauxella sp. JUb87]
MLENYFKNGALVTDEKTQRLLAVQAALEITKASASSSAAAGGSMYNDLAAAKEGISGLADAIQAALKG